MVKSEEYISIYWCIWVRIIWTSELVKYLNFKRILQDFTFYLEMSKIIILKENGVLIVWLNKLLTVCRNGKIRTAKNLWI